MPAMAPTAADPSGGAYTNNSLAPSASRAADATGIEASQQGEHATRASAQGAVSMSSSPEPPTSVMSFARPRHFALLPLLGAVDFVSAVILSIAILNQTGEALGRVLSPPVVLSRTSGSAVRSIVTDAMLAIATGSPERLSETKRLTLAIVGCSLLRSSTIVVVGISPQVRNMGLVVAVVCSLSALFNVSVANLMLLAGGEDYHHSHPNGVISTLQTIAVPSFFTHPTLALLITVQLAFVLSEWLAYVGIVGRAVRRSERSTVSRRQSRMLAASIPSAQTEHDAEEADIEDEAYDSEETDSEIEAEAQIAAATEEVTVEGRRVGVEEAARLEDDDELDSVRETRPLLGGPSAPRTPSGGSRGASRLSWPRAGPLSIDDEDADESGAYLAALDPEDIVDITPDRALSRKESRRRLRLSMVGTAGTAGSPLADALERENRRRHSGAWSLRQGADGRERAVSPASSLSPSVSGNSQRYGTFQSQHPEQSASRI